jgi:hypothetical protein
MVFKPRPAGCERARAWASLRLDAELSEFEDAFLSAHLGRCAACCEYEESIRGTVLALRAAPLEHVEHAVSVPSHRRVYRVLRPAALARTAAVVVAAVGIAAALTTESASRFPALRVPDVAPADNSDLTQNRALRIAQLGGQPRSATQLGVRGAVLQRTRL